MHSFYRATLVWTLGHLVAATMFIAGFMFLGWVFFVGLWVLVAPIMMYETWKIVRDA